MAIVHPKETILFIVNPFSGISNKADFNTQIDELIDQNRFDYQVHYTEYPGHASEIAKDAVAEKIEIVVAVGGDGSINEVASQLVHTPCKLGIIPEGSGNGFAKHVAIKKSITSSLEILHKGHSKLIDTCKVNNEFFINVSGIGYDAYIAYLTKENEKRGLFPYVSESLKHSIDWQSFQARLVLDGDEHIHKAITIVIANGSMYGYDFCISPNSDIEDGLMEILIVKDAPLYQYFINSYRLLNKTIHESDFIVSYKTKKARIILDKNNYYHKDGEGFQSPLVLDFEIIPKSLHLIVP